MSAMSTMDGRASEDPDPDSRHTQQYLRGRIGRATVAYHGADSQYDDFDSDHSCPVLHVHNVVDESTEMENK